MVMVPPPLGIDRSQVIAADNEDKVMAKQNFVPDATHNPENISADTDEPLTPPKPKSLGRDQAVVTEKIVVIRFSNGEDGFQMSFDSDVNAQAYYDALKQATGPGRRISSIELINLAGVYTLEAGVGKSQDSAFDE